MTHRRTLVGDDLDFDGAFKRGKTTADQVGPPLSVLGLIEESLPEHQPLVDVDDTDAEPDEPRESTARRGVRVGDSRDGLRPFVSRRPARVRRPEPHRRNGATAPTTESGNRIGCEFDFRRTSGTHRHERWTTQTRLDP